MVLNYTKCVFVFLFFSLILTIQFSNAQQQPLLLSEAIHSGLNNYQTIKAKQHYLKASNYLLQNVKNDYLPNILASMQQNYGSINGLYGPGAPYGAFGVSSAGPVFNSQQWNAAFGSLYLISTNWEAFTFGRKQSRIAAANAVVQTDSADVEQEKFVLSVKVAGAYFNLLTAQGLVIEAQANLNRADTFRTAVLARTLNGLNPGVDSSIANSEYSNAYLILIDAISNRQQAESTLAQLLNQKPETFFLDTSFFNRIPQNFVSSFNITANPQVKFFESKIRQSEMQANAIKKSILPGINLFGIFQTRGSGFGSQYSAASPNNYSKSFFDGITPLRSNYIAGLSLAFNIMSIPKIKQQVNAQRELTETYKQEYDQTYTQLQDALILADQRIQNTLQSYREVPIQLKAARDAFLQKSVLYENGLATIIDLQQALYIVNRAETSAKLACINIWQALLLKAAASGDWDLLMQQIK
ncbi:MAG: TolC family protein [Hydrotalea flava]|uniref:TolC family protein n=1 Tax=Hydrotalea TaxID=1004300 RepID=UPI000943E336|nr:MULTISPECIES: TolC family protein [Hydrotalea]NIM35482.1 TolC family protein [Hydrotalea flava]NIM38340.1 TolC family protein [Hydrotalea flava]NIN03511.1 TolC family protein [Hydrotalea flava]NIN15198.1 TolC family protein [Hydrotalea flava]NIO94266.1 TolC family protein [Hydrotalea flava]